MSTLVDIFIPDLGADTDVDLIEVMVSVGDEVEVEDGLVTLETEKASMDVPTTHAGIIKEILVEEGAKVNTGDLIARVEVQEEAAAEAPAPAEQEAPKAVEAPAATPAPAAAAEPMGIEAAEAELKAISASGAQVSCQFVNEQTICSVVEEVFVPDLGDDKDVDLIEVMVSTGDTVEFEDGLITLETEKASMDVPAPFAGEIIELFVEAGSKVNTGDLIAKMVKTVVMESKAPTPVAPVAEPAKQEAPKAPASVQAVAAVTAPESTAVLSEKAKKIYASPSVRRIAREFGVELGFVKGSGRKGRILKDDIKAYVKEQLSKPAVAATGNGGAGLGFNFPPLKEVDFSQFGDIETVELTKIQKISGPSLHRNAVSMPHVTQFDEADITEMESFRKAQNAIADGFKLSPLVFVLKAVAKALEIHPRFNSSLSPDGQSLVMKKYFHIAVAVDTPNGLVVPVIRDVDKKGFKQLAEELKEVSLRARDGKLKPADMQGACFTISSLGGIGGTKFTPIINAPEVAILGLSKSEMKPVWNGSEFEPKLMLPLSLSYDHKVIDGADGARFTTTISKLLSDIRLLSL